MAGVNRFIGIGNLGQDPETRYLPSGAAVTNISIAITEKWKDSSGEQKEHTEWVAVNFFGKLAEIAGEYLKKGAPVYIEGRIRTDKWEKDGQTHYRTKIIADRLQMLGSKPTGDGGQQQRSDPPSQGQQKPQGGQGGAGGGRGARAFDSMDDDIPFAPIGRGISGHVI